MDYLEKIQNFKFKLLLKVLVIFGFGYHLNCYSNESEKVVGENSVFVKKISDEEFQSETDLFSNNTYSVGLNTFERAHLVDNINSLISYYVVNNYPSLLKEEGVLENMTNFHIQYALSFYSEGVNRPCLFFPIHSEKEFRSEGLVFIESLPIPENESIDSLLGLYAFGNTTKKRVVFLKSNNGLIIKAVIEPSGKAKLSFYKYYPFNDKNLLPGDKTVDTQLKEIENLKDYFRSKKSRLKNEVGLQNLITGDSVAVKDEKKSKKEFDLGKYGYEIVTDSGDEFFSVVEISSKADDVLRLGKTGRNNDLYVSANNDGEYLLKFRHSLGLASELNAQVKEKEMNINLNVAKLDGGAFGGRSYFFRKPSSNHIQFGLDEKIAESVTLSVYYDKRYEDDGGDLVENDPDLDGHIHIPGFKKIDGRRLVIDLKLLIE